MTQDMHTKFALTARHQGLQNQLTFQSHRKITCYLVMWFLMQLRSCDFVGAIHDRVTNDAGGAEPARCSTLATIPTLILESLPSSTLPNRLDFEPTGKTFLGKMIIQAVLIVSLSASCHAGLLGAGTGEGSCPAAPFR